MARSRRDALNVFVNAPFDPTYDPLLEAMVFMIHAAGFRARAPLKRMTAAIYVSTNWYA